MPLLLDKRPETKKEVILQVLKLFLLLSFPAFLCFVSLDQLEQERSICLIKNIFGCECYGCGITKAIISVVQLDLLRAYHYNRMIVVVMPLLIYLWGREVVRTIKRLRKRAKKS